MQFKPAEKCQFADWEGLKPSWVIDIPLEKLPRVSCVAAVKIGKMRKESGRVKERRVRGRQLQQDS